MVQYKTNFTLFSNRTFSANSCSINISVHGTKYETHATSKPSFKIIFGGTFFPNTKTYYFKSYVRGGADKSLGRPTSRSRRTKSIVSLERGVCSCAELQVFSCYRGWKEACQATRAISTTSRRELSSSTPRTCKARRRRKFTPFWQKHYGNIHHRMPSSKIGWPSLNVVIFPPVLRLVLDDPKQWPSRRLLIKFTT